MMERYVYPFSAIVGQDKMKLALILNAIHPAIGGVLIRGEKGTGKSTAVRALARLLPELTVVADCPYHCDPDARESLCPDCRERAQRGEPLPRGRRRMRVVELREAGESPPAGFAGRYEAQDAEIGRRIAEGIERFPLVKVPAAILRALAELNVSLQVDGHRADLVGRKAAQALAAYRGVPEVGVGEVNEVADMVLAHRVKAGGRRELTDLGQTLSNLSRASRA